MAKPIGFSATSYSGTSKEFRSNGPDLVLNGDDFTLTTAIVASGSWTLFNEVGHNGNSMTLEPQGGPDADGSQKDHADWGGVVPFHVKPIRHS